MRRFAATPILALAFALGCEKTTTDPEITAEAESPSITAQAVALSFRQLAPGGGHTCGLTTDDRAYCWGLNIFGQLGDGTTTRRLTPVPVAGGLRFVQIAAGGNFTCGLRRIVVFFKVIYRAYCWGSNAQGQLGNGQTTNRLTPGAVAGGLSLVQVSAGINHACGITTANRAYCWGHNAYGSLGDGTTTTRRAPVAVAGGLRFVQVSIGGPHTCALTTLQHAYCWGRGSGGQLGTGTIPPGIPGDPEAQQHTPVAVAGGLRFLQISAGSYGHTCGLTTTNRAYCWGVNRDGGLGDGTTSRRLAPVAVLGGLSFAQLGAGRFHTCGMTTLGKGYCWGLNELGQLGNPAAGDFRLTPFPIAGGRIFKRVEVGSEDFACGLANGNQAYCWGHNLHGQLGDGTTTTRRTPVAVAGTT